MCFATRNINVNDKENNMHQSRRTHNAHNETQRRLKKVVFNSRLGFWSYNNTVFLKSDRRKVDGCFYVSNPKSNNSYWRWAKKRLHKIWRRKSSEALTFTYKDAIGCSIYDLW